MKHTTSHQRKPAPSRIARLAATVIVTVLLVLISATMSRGTRADQPSPFAAHTRTNPPDAQSTTGPIPPPDVMVTGALAATDALTVTIPNVPAYQWHHGCGPTAAGMIVGYWDGQGFDALVPGDALTQTVAVDEMMASEGPASNYTDYCEPIDYYPDLFPDLSEDPPGDEHVDECVADYMKTSQSYQSNRYGWSWFSDVGPALNDYARQTLGTSDTIVSTQNLYVLWDGSLNWDSFRAEMDAGHPMVLLVDTDGDGGTDHFVTAIGYRLIDDVEYYACLNTWDDDIHWFEFAPMEVDQLWGIFGGVTFHILKVNHQMFCPVVMRDY